MLEAEFELFKLEVSGFAPDVHGIMFNKRKLFLVFSYFSFQLLACGCHVFDNNSHVSIMSKRKLLRRTLFPIPQLQLSFHWSVGFSICFCQLQQGEEGLDSSGGKGGGKEGALALVQRHVCCC